MKVMTPHYYKDFRCIAGACTDTCCAGWDVDVDKDSYKYYKTVKGAFGKRLKSVMVPSQDGECTFTLKEGGRCPFLNDDNLCDLYIELGEDKLCETCAEFPRFINDYGNIREIVIKGRRMLFVYEYCLSEAFLRQLTPEENSVIVNLHNWNGKSCISPQAYCLAKKMKVILLTMDDFYGYINEIRK